MRTRYACVVLPAALLLLGCPPQGPLGGGAPATPAGLTVGSPSSTTLLVSWTSSTDATSYQVFRDTTSGGAFSTKAFDGTATTFTDTPLAPSTTYYYKVQATNAAGTSALSAAVSGITLASGVAPATPTGLAVSNPKSTTLDVSWNSSTGAATYQVYRDTSSGGTFATEVFNGSGTAFTDSNLAWYTTYYYEVKATNFYGSSALSSSASGTTAPTVQLAYDINVGAGSGSPTGLTVFGTNLYFAGTSDGTNYQLFKYDGSTLTALGASANAVANRPQYLTVFGGKLYMQALGNTLYSYDGSTLVAATPAVSQPAYLLANGLTLYMRGYDSTYGQELWSDDGSSSAVRVTDINSGAADSAPAQLAVMSGTLYFSATDGTTGRQLYSYSSGTATMVGSPITTGGFAGGDGVPTGAPIVVLGSKLCFPATPTGASPYYLYTSDGSTTPTAVTTSIQVSQSSMIVYNGALYLRGKDSTYGWELYRYDGTNLTRVTDINTGGDSLAATVTFGEFNSELYFGATADGTNYQLYKYDGTNVAQVHTFNAALAASPGQLAVLNNKLYFSGWDPTNGTELWVLY